MSEPDLIGRYTIERPSFSRQIAIDAFAALPESHPMVAMLELDVSRAQAAIARRQAAGEQVSLFAFVIHCIAKAVAEHPAMNGVMHGRNVVRFDDVDISVPVEVQTDGERVPREVVLRRPQDASPLQVYQQLTQARGAHDAEGTLGREDAFNRRLGRRSSSRRTASRAEREAVHGGCAGATCWACRSRLVSPASSARSSPRLAR